MTETAPAFNPADTVPAGTLKPGDTFAHTYMRDAETVRTVKSWTGRAPGAYLGADMVTVRTDEGSTIRLGRHDRVTVHAPVPAAAPAGLPVTPPPASPPGLPAGDHDETQLEAALDLILEHAEGRPVGVDTVRELMRAAYRAGVEMQASRS